MNFFTFGLTRTSVARSVRTLIRPPTAASVHGLVHAECMTAMRLGSAVISAGRMQPRNLALFAAWESEDAIEEFLANAPLGQELSAGWHLRMSFLRRWGSVRELDGLPEDTGKGDPAAPVAAYTLARLKIPEAPRFFRWGRPVEELVRDHPEATFATAAIRYPRSVATFSIWNSQRALRDMIQGHDDVDRPERHASAMRELDRRNFHHEFVTLRFKPLSEHGSWQGRSGFVRGLGAGADSHHNSGQ